MAKNYTLTLHAAILVDESSKFHLTPVDIIVQQGVIAKISPAKKGPSKRGENIDATGYYVSPGWCDIGAYCGEPGDEIHETLASLCQAASEGGYTQLGLFSNQARPFDNRHIMSDVKLRSQSGVQLHPIAAITKGLEGRELAEILDLDQQSPGLFTDGIYRQFDNSLLYKALEYVKQCDGKIALLPGTLNGLKNGQVNESHVSAQMGIPGIPGFEEVAALSSELALVSYTQTAAYVHLVSHRESVDLIALRLGQGLPISASVSAMHLCHTEEDLLGFDENFKVLPPLRSEADRNALIQGLRSNTISAVVSNHQPISPEQKEKAFGASPFGASGIETVFHSVLASIEDVTAEEIGRWLSVGPRKILNLPTEISVGSPADLTIYSLKGKTNYKRNQTKSQSRNTPYTDRIFKGHILGTILSTSNSLI